MVPRASWSRLACTTLNPMKDIEFLTSSGWTSGGYLLFKVLRGCLGSYALKVFKFSRLGTPRSLWVARNSL